jgi:hypothetical protein
MGWHQVLLRSFVGSCSREFRFRLGLELFFVHPPWMRLEWVYSARQGGGGELLVELAGQLEVEQFNLEYIFYRPQPVKPPPHGGLVLWSAAGVRISTRAPLQSLRLPGTRSLGRLRRRGESSM